VCKSTHETTKQPLTHLCLEARAVIETNADLPDQYKHHISQYILIYNTVVPCDILIVKEMYELNLKISLDRIF